MSPVAWSGEAPAKVNLYLAVLDREASGYHRIETVLQALEWCDEVELEVEEGAATTLELQGLPQNALGPAPQNLAVRAAELFREEARARGVTCRGLRIRLIKRVAHGAGLGGGSSDAATVLRGLNELHSEPFEPSELMRLGARLGADVPFFVSGVARALGRGHGDQIVRLEALPSRHILLVLPDQPIATAWAYEALASHREEVPKRETSSEADLPVFGETWAATAARARNDFEEVLFPLRPELREIKSVLTSEGASPAMLSGSGSSVFGVFETQGLVEKTERQVLSRFTRARTARTTTRS